MVADTDTAGYTDLTAGSRLKVLEFGNGSFDDLTPSTLLDRRSHPVDGRELPKDPNPDWMGYSVGRWDKDALIVETLGFRPYFRSILSADHVEYPKPHPEIYLRTAEMLGFPPSACIAFEDSTVGIESAKRAGMVCVAIASTFPADVLRRHGQANWIAENFEELDLAKLRALAAVQGQQQRS